MKSNYKICIDNTPKLKDRYYAYLPDNFKNTGNPDYTPLFPTKKLLLEHLKKDPLNKCEGVPRL